MQAQSSLCLNLSAGVLTGANKLQLVVYGLATVCEGVFVVKYRSVTKVWVMLIVNGRQAWCVCHCTSGVLLSTLLGLQMQLIVVRVHLDGHVFCIAIS
jgi:hypothetical protein